MSFFEGLVVTEDGTPVSVTYIGATPYYVVDDQGFRRHIEAREVDRLVLEQFAGQVEANRDDAAMAMMRLMGQDDLFTKAMVDSALQNIDLDQVLGQGLPPAARQWLGMMGFRVVINLHGEVVQIDTPSSPEGPDDED
jgi:hypothetical protein